jgi:macrolide transport system ATP-binding/permease protein
VLALAVAAIGLYGLMANAVVRRRREMGIRLALGAQTGSLGWLVMREAMLLSVGGIGLGLAGALLSSRVLHSVLYGVTATDAPTLSLAALVLLIVMVGAALPPTWRSLHADPLEALRVE